MTSHQRSSVSGNLTKQKETFEGLAVILDLKDFTGFCDQRDPHHEVPRFLDKFLRWLFDRIREELFDSNDGNDVILWSHLPIFGKFLGDGILFLWDATDISPEARRKPELVYVLRSEFSILPRDRQRQLRVR